MTLLVLRPGVQTTVQDRGRNGFRHLGVGLGGALDLFSAGVANLLVGNDDGAAVLEIALSGPTLRFERSALVALTGATVDARVEGIALPGTNANACVGGLALPGWRPVALPAGSELRLGACRDGARAYLAIAGGFATTPTMGSRATDVRAGFGGYEGRALRAGDRLAFGGSVIDVADIGVSGSGVAAIGEPALEVSDSARPTAPRRDESRTDPDLSVPTIAPWWVDPRPDLDPSTPALVQLLPGADALADPQALFEAPWRVAPASDRQGLRLEGRPLQPADTRERVSAPVAPGSVQLPPDGRPIVLLGEAQTVGGYPVIGHVASVDLPRLAQCRPGDALRFMPATRDQALVRLREREQRLARMRIAVAAKLAGFPPARR